MNTSSTHKDHARISMSGLSRHLNCPGSVEAEQDVLDAIVIAGEGIRDWSNSPEAEEGTEAHFVMDRYFNGGKLPETYPDGDMAHAVRELIEYVETIRKVGDDLWCEKRVVFSKHVWGTLDLALWNPTTRSLNVIDFKYGLGDRIPAKENYQLSGYTLALRRELGIKPIHSTFTIFQPRKGHISTWVPEPMWLESIAIQMHLAELRVESAKEHNLHRTASGENCQYCLASGGCSVQDKACEEAVSQKLDPPGMAKALASRRMVSNWLVSIPRHADLMDSSGAEIPGWKRVKGRRSRRWKSTEALTEALNLNLSDISQATKTKIMSPAQFEKAHKDLYDLIEPCVDNFRTNPQWVSEDDPKPAITSLESDINQL